MVLATQVEPVFAADKKVLRELNADVAKMGYDAFIARLHKDFVDPPAIGDTSEDGFEPGEPLPATPVFTPPSNRKRAKRSASTVKDDSSNKNGPPHVIPTAQWEPEMLKRTLMAQFGASMDLLKTDVGAMQQLQKSLEGKFDTNNSSLVILMQRLTENMEGHIKQQRLDTATQLEEAFNKAT